MDYYDWDYHKSKYVTPGAALRATRPEALKDPVIALAVTQIELANLAIDARMTQLLNEDS